MNDTAVYLTVVGIMVIALIFIVRVWRSLNNKVDNRQEVLEEEFYNIVYKKNIQDTKKDSLGEEHLS